MFWGKVVGVSVIAMIFASTALSAFTFWKIRAFGIVCFYEPNLLILSVEVGMMFIALGFMLFTLVSYIWDSAKEIKGR